MASLIRVTIFGFCVLAGVAVALGLAAHFAAMKPTIAESPLSAHVETVGTADSAKQTASADQPSRHDATTDSLHAPVDEAQATQAALVNRTVLPPAYQPAPYYMHYPPSPTSNQLDRLEEALQRVADASTQSQIRKLEDRIAELADARDKQSAVAMYRNPQLTPPEPQQVNPNVQVATAAQVAADSSSEAPQLNLPELPRGQNDNHLNLRGHDLRELLEFLSAEAGLNVVASDNVKGKVTASLSDMDAESAILAILRMTGFAARKEGKFLYVGTTADLERMQQLSHKMQTRIYRTEYVTAAEMKGLITPLLSTNGKITVSSPAETSIPADTVQTGGDDFAGNEVVMVHDYETVLLQIDEIISQIDQRPRQVMIEAMIVSVALDDSHSVGINLETFQKSKSLRLVSGNPLANLGQISLTKGGLQFGVLDGNVAAFIDALEGIGDTNVIAAPHLLCLNKQKAEILIGDQKGYLSTTQTETATTQTVEFLDLGTQLRIRPFISADGMVRLEVHPELSTGDVKLVGTFALPEKTTTQVTTNIMCRDGCTVVIGGLIREDHARTVTQAAIIGNIPILGALFRNKKIEDQRSEIIVMLTPKIVQDPALCRDGSVGFGDVSQRRAAVELRRISPVAKHHYSRRYYRLAQSAWYAGNLPEAHRFLEISLQMQPHNILAKRLYGVMMSGEGRTVPLPGSPGNNTQEIPEVFHEDGGELLPPGDPTSPQVPRRLEPPTPDQVRTQRRLGRPVDEVVRLTPVPIESPIRPAAAQIPLDGDARRAIGRQLPSLRFNGVPQNESADPALRPTP